MKMKKTDILVLCNRKKREGKLSLVAIVNNTLSLLILGNDDLPLFRDKTCGPVSKRKESHLAYLYNDGFDPNIEWTVPVSNIRSFQILTEKELAEIIGEKNLKKLASQNVLNDKLLLLETCSKTSIDRFDKVCTML